MDDKIFVTKASLPPYDEYIESIKPLWDSHWLTNMGEYHQRFETELKEYLDVPEVSLMVNGHMALEMTIQAFDFPKGAEIITTPFTFISTTHAIVRNGLVPVFCDVKESDGTIDETQIEALITDKTVAVLPVHVYGNVCNVEAIKEIADKYKLKVIYDAAHAFGVKYKGRGIGNYGDASIFSFHATKVFNSIEGGAATFSNHGLYEKLYNLKNFGIRGEEIVESVGANAKMNEFCAIMGLCNLKHIDVTISERKEKWEHYCKYLSRMDGIKLFQINPNVQMNYSYMPVMFESMKKRDEVYALLKDNNIYARKYFYPLVCEQTLYKFNDAQYKVARKVSESILTLPFYETLSEDVIERIVTVLQNIMK